MPEAEPATPHRVRDRHPKTPSLRLSVAAAVVGVATAFALCAFRAAVTGIAGAADGIRHHLGGFRGALLALVPAAGGLLAGLAVRYGAGTERHHGVGGILEALALRGGALKHRWVPAKAVGAAVAIGSGVSVGPEDPSVQIGTGLGSFLGGRLRLSDDRVRALVVAGASAAIASAFRAPIAGVFFALEVLLGEVAAGTIGAALVASVAALVVTHAVEGGGPALMVARHFPGAPWHVVVHVLLGALAGLVAAGYGAAIDLARSAASKVSIPLPLRTALAGLLVGILGLWVPDVLGSGYSLTQSVLVGAGPGLLVLALLVLLKPVATALSVGAGVPGGVFAPALVTGACLGGVFGSGLSGAFPNGGFSPPVFAMVGMGAVLAGAIHAPLTAAMLLFEITDDWRIVVPAFAAVAVSHLVSKRLRHDSVYTSSLTREGVHLEHGRDVDILESILVRDVMETEPPTVLDTATAVEAFDSLEAKRRHGLVVVDGLGRLVGVVTLADLDRAADGPAGLFAKVGDCCARDLIVAHAQETLAAALARMSPRDLGRLPVVDPADPRRLVGLLRRNDVIRAYDVAARRRRS